MSNTPDNIRNMWEEAVKKRNLQVVKRPQPPQPPAQPAAAPKPRRPTRGHEPNAHWWNDDGSGTPAYFQKDEKRKFNTDFRDPR
jgi:hypothetical protein